MRTRRHGEVKSLTQDHTASERQSLHLLSGSKFYLTWLDSPFILGGLPLHISPVCPFSILSKASMLPCGCFILSAKLCLLLGPNCPSQSLDLLELLSNRLLSNLEEA